jgi:hypothetical protein
MERAGGGDPLGQHLTPTDEAVAEQHAWEWDIDTEPGFQAGLSMERTRRACDVKRRGTRIEWHKRARDRALKGLAKDPRARCPRTFISSHPA